MRVLVYEYINGGGRAAPSSPALAREGDAMLGALIGDLVEAPGVTLTVLRDRRLPPPAAFSSAITWLGVEPDADAIDGFSAALRHADAAWPIAPETAGILARLCETAEMAVKPLLTSPAHAVHLAGGKLATVERLQRHGIPVVPTRRWLAVNGAPPFPLPVVMKPDDGVGGEGACIIRNRVQWAAASQNPPSGNTIIQPLLPGEALSLSALFAHGRAVLLSINRQHVQQLGDALVFRGCTVNGIDRAERPFSHLLERIAAAFPELWGYAGVDMLRDGEHLTVLEINPRLTTSYVGLRPALGINPARLVLELWQTGELPRLSPLPLRPVEVRVEHA